MIFFEFQPFGFGVTKGRSCRLLAPTTAKAFASSSGTNLEEFHPPRWVPELGGGFVGSEVKDFFMQILDAWKSIPPRELINISKTFGNWEKTHLQTCLGWGVSWSGRELVIEPPPISKKIKWKTCLNPRHCTLKYLVQMQLYTSISISTSISIYLDKNDDLFRRDFGLAVGTSPVGLFVGFVVSWRLHGSTVHHLTPARSGMSKKPKQRFFSQPKTVKTLPKNRCFLDRKLKGESTLRDPSLHPILQGFLKESFM